jgi:ankyrin repeat protein
MIDTLLNAGAKAEVTNRNGISPLYMASLYGNPAVINQLIRRGADAKAKGPNGETMVMLASRNGNPEAVKALIAAGADVNAKEPIRGTTALMWAVEQKHPAAVKALLEGGADFKARSGNAGNPQKLHGFFRRKQQCRGTDRQDATLCRRQRRAISRRADPSWQHFAQ